MVRSEDVRGDLLVGLCGQEENRAGRTELMPKLAEACVESGSGLGFLFSVPAEPLG